jgi:hypothetical protein
LPNRRSQVIGSAAPIPAVRMTTRLGSVDPKPSLTAMGRLPKVPPAIKSERRWVCCPWFSPGRDCGAGTRRPPRLSGAMITEYPAEDRYDQSEYEPFWAAAALDLPLSQHTATRRQGKIRGAGDKTLRDASSRDTGVLSGAVVVRSDLFRRLRASSPPDTGHRRVRAGVGTPPALNHRLHIPRASRRGDLPVQEPALAPVLCPARLARSSAGA